jgi:hypothetical protein
MFHLIRAVAGSKLYGTHTHTSDDDVVGIFVPDKEEKLGLNCREHIIESKDSTVYELGKYVKLVVGGNPTILQLLYTPQPMWLQWTEEWPRFQSELRDLCVSQLCRPAFLGYLEQQKRKAIEGRSQRPELVEKYGFDTKFMAHAVRLGQLGREILRTGKMTFPLVNRDFVLAIRHGQYPQAYCLGVVDQLEAEIRTTSSILPPTPDYARINRWLAEAYMNLWGGTR